MARIVEASGLLFEIPFEKEFRTAVRSSQSSRNLVLCLKDDEGDVGWGEGVPTHPYFEGETLEHLILSLRSLSKVTIGCDPFELGRNIEKLARTKKICRSALSAADIALHDLFTRKIKVPLCAFLGRPKTAIETSYTIGIGAPKEMAAEAKRKMSEGFRRIKIKVGTGLQEDMERVDAVESVLSGRARLSVDANQAYSLEKAVRFCSFLSKFENVEFFEQPLPKRMLKETAELRRRTGIKIMLDEGVRDAGGALEAVWLDACDYVNIKLMKCGGISEALRIAGVCEAAGLKCMVGCYSESSIGIAAGVHFALSSVTVHLADLDSDLMTPRALAKRGGAWIRKGKRGVEPSPGIGIVEVDKSLLIREIFVSRL